MYFLKINLTPAFHNRSSVVKIILKQLTLNSSTCFNNITSCCVVEAVFPHLERQKGVDKSVATNSTFCQLYKNKQSVSREPWVTGLPLQQPLYQLSHTNISVAGIQDDCGRAVWFSDTTRHGFVLKIRCKRKHNTCLSQLKKTTELVNLRKNRPLKYILVSYQRHSWV